MNRKNRTSVQARDHGSEPVLITYRELAPSAVLRPYVRAYFSFVPGESPWLDRRAVTREVRFGERDSFCSPVFAAGNASIVVDLGATCTRGTGWTRGTPARSYVVGPLRSVGGGPGDSRAAMLGAYLEPAATRSLLHVPAADLTDRVIDLADLWQSRAASLLSAVVEDDEAARVDRLEAALVAALRQSRPGPSIDIARLAHAARTRRYIDVGSMANAAGVSTRHLARLFEEFVGMTPKRFCRLARFQGLLGYAGTGPGVNWAQAAWEAGYADQSHMIAESREFSGLTPQALATEAWFHPFILEARAARANR